MVQNYQDAMAICRFTGPPDLFITFTCNQNWSEIEKAMKFIPRQKIVDRPDIVARVFKIKLEQLMRDLTHGQHFGVVMAGIKNNIILYLYLKFNTFKLNNSKKCFLCSYIHY